MSPALYVGLRYAGLVSRGKGQFISFISLFSLIGIMLGMIALIVVVSVMNGFDAELKRRVLGAVPHVVVKESAVAVTAPDIVARAPFLRRNGLLLGGRRSQLVGIHGIDPLREADMSNIPGHMRTGQVADLANHEDGMIVGAPLAWRLGLTPGDVVTLIVPEAVASSQSSVRPVISRWRILGTFEIDAEPDYSLVLVNVETLAAALDAASPGERLALADIFAAPALTASLRRDGIMADDWTRDYGDFFRTVRMEKNMMFILLLLVVVIAAFNIVSSLSMMVREKRADIAVMRTMGLTPLDVLLVFVTQGCVIGFAGVFLGLAIGVPLALATPDLVAAGEALFGVHLLAGTYFNQLPVEVRPSDLVAIVLVSLMVCILATLYPAWRAARLAPAAVLRYE